MSRPSFWCLVAIVAGIPVAAYFADTQSQIEELENGRNQETKLKEEYLGKKKQAINLDLAPPAAARDRLPSSARCCGSCRTARRWTRCSSTSTRRVSAAACSSSCSSRRPPRP